MVADCHRDLSHIFRRVCNCQSQGVVSSTWSWRRDKINMVRLLSHLLLDFDREVPYSDRYLVMGSASRRYQSGFIQARVRSTVDKL